MRHRKSGRKLGRRSEHRTAMLRNIVDRAKTDAVKSSIRSGSDVAIDVDMLASAVQEEYEQTCDEILDADPQQWSRVNGIGDGRVVAIRRPSGERE